MHSREVDKSIEMLQQMSLELDAAKACTEALLSEVIPASVAHQMMLGNMLTPGVCTHVHCMIVLSS
jgi:hypothetical protein